MPIEYSIVKDNLMFYVDVFEEDSAQNPAPGGIWSEIFSSDQNSPIYNQERIAEIIELYKNDCNKPYVFLSYCVQEKCSWNIQGEVDVCLSDTVDNDGLFFAGQEFIDKHSGKTPDDFKAELLSFARKTCKDYTAWCNGETYAFNIGKATYDAKIGADPKLYCDMGSCESVECSYNFYSHEEALRTAISCLQVHLNNLS